MDKSIQHPILENTAPNKLYWTMWKIGKESGFQISNDLLFEVVLDCLEITLAKRRWSSYAGHGYHIGQVTIDKSCHELESYGRQDLCFRLAKAFGCKYEEGGSHG